MLVEVASNGSVASADKNTLDDVAVSEDTEPTPPSNVDRELTFDDAILLAQDISVDSDLRDIGQILRAVSNRCINALLFEPSELTRILKCMEDGCDFYDDIVLTIRDKCGHGLADGTFPTINGWGYLRDAFYEARNSRQADAMPDGRSHSERALDGTLEP